MEDRKITVLAIDDDQGDAELLRRHLDDIPGMAVTFHYARCADEGLDALKGSEIDVIFLDYLLGDQNGMDVLEKIRASDDVRGVIVLTGQTSASLAVGLTHAGADDYIDKHMITADLLRRAIDNALAQQQRREANRQMAKLLVDLKDANRLLERKNDRLGELYDTAHQFVDNVSHEFRTPLAVIKEYASLMRDGVLGAVNDEQEQFLDVIGNRVEDLTLMVDDMLDISRFGAGMMHVTRKPCRIEDVIRHVRPNLDRRASINNIRLDNQIPADLPDIFCDPEKIGRTIINLAVNALKFAPERGNVRIWVRHDPTEKQITVGVTDNGPGISPENRQLIFERFEQVNGDLRQSTKGFGLGLNIAKELVHINFGQIMVDSEVGKGSTFSFTVPTTEPTNLIDRYLNWLAQIEEPAVISMVWAKIDAAADAVAIQESGDFIRKVARPRDLVLAPARGVWLLIAQCERAEVNALSERLEQSRIEANRNRPSGDLPMIRYKIDGTWEVPEQQPDFLDHFRTAIAAGEVACG